MREIRGKWSLSIANFIKFSLKTQGSNDYLKMHLFVLSVKSLLLIVTHLGYLWFCFYFRLYLSFLLYNRQLLSLNMKAANRHKNKNQVLEYKNLTAFKAM